jgi:hypothetical protein
MFGPDFCTLEQCVVLVAWVYARVAAAERGAPASISSPAPIETTPAQASARHPGAARDSLALRITTP